MELFIYDASLELLGVIDEISALVWMRRYWECGEFSLLVPMTSRHAALLQNGRLLARKDTDEMGQIRYLTVTKDENGLEQIEVQGRFLTHWLRNRLLLKSIVSSLPTHELLSGIVQENLIAPADSRRVIPNLTLANMSSLVSEPVNCSCAAYANALDTCSERAKLAKLGFKIITDLRQKKHFFLVYKGLDRTSGQTENAICIFSPDFDNVLSQEYTHSVENMATAAYVGGEETEGEPRQVVEVSDDARTGLARIEYFDDSSTISRSYTEDGLVQQLSLEDYIALLTSRGHVVLDQKTESLSFSSHIDTHANLAYKTDFDLGDRVTCVNKRWGIRIDARITEIIESYESGKEELEITFGVSIPSLNSILKGR
jgi:hypothetical protein